MISNIGKPENIQIKQLKIYEWQDPKLKKKNNILEIQEQKPTENI